MLLPHQNPRNKEPSKPGLESVSPDRHFFPLRVICQAFCHLNAEWLHTHLSYVILFPDHSCLRVNTWNVISAIRPTLPDAAGPPFNTWLAKLQEWGQWPHLLPPHLSIPPVGTLHPSLPYKDDQDALYKSSKTRALNSVADVHPQSSFPDGETQSGWRDMTLLSLH